MSDAHHSEGHMDSHTSTSSANHHEEKHDDHAKATVTHQSDTHAATAEHQRDEGPKDLSRLAIAAVAVFDHVEAIHEGRKIAVNPVVSKFATWYEKLRNAMEYREDEVILRATIERILKRKLLLGGNAKTTAEPLVRELIWARYLGDTVGETTVERVEHVIDLYLQLRLKVLAQHKFSDSVMNEWTYHLMSSHLEHILHQNPEAQVISNLMFQLLKDNITIVDDSEDTRNAQVFLAVRKAFSRDDIAFLRFQMFQQIFGELTPDSLESIARDFPKGYKEIQRQMTYRKKEVIYSYVKKQNAAFLILEDIFRDHQKDLPTFLRDSAAVRRAISQACEKRYDTISSKVQRAIIRSVVFILLTKLLFAFVIEGTYDRIVYGEIIWQSIIINTGIPPLLMIVVGLFLRTPDEQNTKRIAEYIATILYEDHPKLSEVFDVRLKDDKENPVLNTIFMITWLLAFCLSFGGIIFVLSNLHFNMVSIFIFVFFSAIVSFLAYRISLTASLYRLGERQGLLTPLVDFFFVPVIRVGRQLTEGISQINVIIFLFDFIIETPFKALFAFFEQLFHFLHTKRDELG